MKSLTNVDIGELLKNNKKFLGCIMRNEDFKLNQNQGIIINMDDIEGEGTHWIALFRTKTHLCYFDSFGLDPIQEVVDYGKKIKVNILFTNNDCQNINSVICGWYAVYFIKEMIKGKSFYDIVYKTTDDKFIEKYFNK